MAQYLPTGNADLHSTVLDFLDNSPESILCLDQEFRLSFFNNTTNSLFKKHFPKGLEKGADFIEILRVENQGLSEVWLENLAIVASKKEAHKFECNYTSDEGFKYFKIRIHPIDNEKGDKGFICRLENDSQNFLKLRLEKLLNNFKTTLFSTTNEQDLLWSITEDILSNLFLEDALILMKSGNNLVSRAVFGSKLRGVRKINSELSIEIGRGIVGSVAASKTPEIVNDTSKDLRYFRDHFEAGSEIAVPIISSENELLGIINCESGSKNFFLKIHLDILSSVAEITAQKIDQIRKADELRITREYNNAVLNSAPTSFLLLGKDKNILSLNRLAIEVMPTFSGSQVKIGGSYKTIIQEKYREEFCLLFDACLKGEIQKTEKKISEPEEEDCWIKFTLSPAINSDEQIFGVALNIQNISSDKLAQTLMQERNESLEMANKEMDKVLYSVSHDLRAPVSNVIGLSSLIAFDTDINEIKEYNSLIQSSMRRMDNFIKNILAFSRNSKVEPHYEMVNIGELIDGIIQDHSYIKGIGSIQFEMNLECKEIVTDHQRLSVILSNLISNAIKYHDPSKEIQRVKLTSYADELNVIIEVEDNGLGIEEANLSKLFNMYYMVNAMERSSGIGLYILKDTLKLMHGNIEARSKVGEGSCFTISLPKISPHEISSQED